MGSHKADGSHTMVGRCPQHGYVAGDAIDGEFPNRVYCGGCSSLLEKCIAAPSKDLEDNRDVTMEFEE